MDARHARYASNKAGKGSITRDDSNVPATNAYARRTCTWNLLVEAPLATGRPHRAKLATKLERENLMVVETTLTERQNRKQPGSTDGERSQSLLALFACSLLPRRWVRSRSLLTVSFNSRMERLSTKTKKSTKSKAILPPTLVNALHKPLFLEAKL